MSSIDRPSPKALALSIAGPATGPTTLLTPPPTVRAASPRPSSRKPATTPMTPATIVERKRSATKLSIVGRAKKPMNPVAITAAVASWSALTWAALAWAALTTSV
eukprot:scaffold11019_cov75-Phaeocystis_antarctica.AAC.2